MASAMKSTDPHEIKEQYLQEHLPNVNVVASGPHLTTLKQKPGITICDFCGAIPAPHLFPAESLLVDTIIVQDEHGSSADTFESIGDWGACDACFADVNANNHGGLLERAMEHERAAVEKITPPGKRAEVDKMLRAVVANSHAAFFHARRK